MATENIQQYEKIHLLSKKILPSTLLERLNNNKNQKRATNVDSFQQCEKSWRENVRGACGLFDISGFSRLAAKLSEEENNVDSPKQNKIFKKSNTEEIGSINNNSDINKTTTTEGNNSNNDTFKIKRLSSKGRRASTIKVLDLDTTEEIYASIDIDNKNSNRKFFRHADKILGEEMGRQGQGAEALAT